MFGDGQLAAAVAAALAAHGSVEQVGKPDQVGEPDPAAPDGAYAVLVAVADTWDTSAYPDVRRACAAAGLPWLPVRAEFGTVVAGPLERAGIPGCVACMDARRQRARRDPAALDAIWEHHADTLRSQPSSWLTGLGCHTVGALVAGEATRAARHAGRASLVDQAALYVDLETLAVTRHRFIPEPGCPDCGRLPDDTPELAKITLAAHPKPRPDTYRIRDVADTLDDLLDTYVDTESGLIRSVAVATAGGVAAAAAQMPTRVPGEIAGYGRTRSYRDSRLVAVLEALERWGGMRAGGKRTVVKAGYAELGNRALDPRTLGTHPASSYQRPDFPYRPFTEDAVCAWVWGYSFARQEPILVPETVAYYSAPNRMSRDRGFVYDTSNGCALGSCLEEAILYGILELAERDAFLLTWYARTPVPRIDLHTARDRTIPLQVAAITAETGYQVAAYDTTAEQGIPSVWVMARRPDGDPAKPAALCAAGSHLDPERAVLAAVSELGPLLADKILSFPGNAEAARQMTADPDLVTTMDDHSILYGAREAYGRLDFLTTSTTVRGLADMAAHTRGAFAHTDLRDDLDEVLRRYVDSGLDVIVVDQTTPEHRAGGLACVKAIIPGTVPMTFGYHRRRLDGLPRLYHVPHQLGYRDQPLNPSEINPHPHPFP